MGATAIADNPNTNSKNMAARNFFERGGAPANSRQINTPQAADIMVAPCPME